MAERNPREGRGLVDVRLLSADEWRVARDARLAALRDAPGSFLTAGPSEWSWTDGHWRRSCATSQWVVAQAGDTVVGLARLTNGGIGPHVESVWTHPEHRRRGIASALVRRLVQAARELGPGDVFVWVIQPNSAAVGLYTSLGFEPTDERQPLGGLDRVEERFRLGGDPTDELRQE
jgi:ribosomal protein S18 acetylase RimI-like enzyme